MADGRAPNLIAQAQLPLESHYEMDIDWETALRSLNADPEVLGMVQKSGNIKLDQPMVTFAIAAYVGSLVSAGSAFDRFYFSGEKFAISESAQRGLRIFALKGRCATCHLLDGSRALFTDGAFHSIGVGWNGKNYMDRGRYEITHSPSDMGAMKTPTLRNVALRPYFMHDGSMSSLKQVVTYYNNGGARGALNMDKRIQPLYLSESDIDDVIAFLQTLSSPIVVLEK
jgi:cytochrome c peroxidase